MSSPSWLSALALTSGLLGALPALANPAQIPTTAAGPACLAPASWARTDGATPQAVEAGGLLTAMAGRAVVLLGEQHDDMDHHRWQLQTLATLHTLRPSMVIGFEMFPRRVQPALDRWVAGELTEAEFLQQAEWGKVWSMPAELYLPLFHFARLNRIPMLALNIDAELTRRIADKGWDGVPEGEREGVGRPAAALPAYEDFLFEIHSQHAHMRMHGKDEGKPARSDAGFRNFVESQLAWDRAMAEALVAGRAHHAAADGSLPLVVGIMGNGHVRHGHGVAHQLVALGEPSVGQLMRVEAATPCAELPAGLADAVFAVPALRQPPPPPPRLGVGLEDAEGGVRIAELTPGSLAERTGLRRGDLITEAAGVPVKRSGQLIGQVRRQPAGTWLPLQVMREGKAVEVVVRFPREAR